MGVLDPDRVRAALGDRLGGRFLQYARPGDDGDALRLLPRVDEHLAELLARHGDVALAHRVASACKRLLRGADARDLESRAAILGAVRYFLETHDIKRDDETLGLDDDALVLDYVAGALS